ncbi:hypothetical protein MMC07_006813 [Pseudocyphellaria aurata]|nr:hypothetical protein [Pseudocyphellaria aurata]
MSMASLRPSFLTFEVKLLVLESKVSELGPHLVKHAEWAAQMKDALQERHAVRRMQVSAERRMLAGSSFDRLGITEPSLRQTDTQRLYTRTDLQHVAAPMCESSERESYAGNFSCKAVSLIRKHWPSLELRPEEVQLYNSDRGKLLLKRICEGHQDASEVARPRLPAEVFDKIMQMLVYNSN